MSYSWNELEGSERYRYEPIEQQTEAQRGDDDERDISHSSCFIATAVYGNQNAPEVQALRDFRDNVLMQNSPGRRIVDLYYSGLGKTIADFIKERMPAAIPIIRKGLDYLVNK